MTGSRLAALLDQATPPTHGEDTWEEKQAWDRFNAARSRLEGIAEGDGDWPVARLLVDMADVLERFQGARDPDYPDPETEALLARFAALDEKAGGA